VPGPGSCSLLPEAVPHCLSAITLVRVESDAAPAENLANRLAERVRGVADRSSLGIVSLVAGRDSPLPTWPPSRSIPTGRYH